MQVVAPQATLRKNTRSRTSSDFALKYQKSHLERLCVKIPEVAPRATLRKNARSRTSSESQLTKNVSCHNWQKMQVVAPRATLRKNARSRTSTSDNLQKM